MLSLSGVAGVASDVGVAAAALSDEPAATAAVFGVMVSVGCTQR